MKVIALGGSGAMGRRAVQDLASRDIVKEITIADFNIGEAQQLARSLGTKCRAVKVDANDHTNLVETMRGHTVALGTIGPFYKYEVRIARACIEAGVHYVSICDDYDAAEGILRLDEAAREKGLTLITGVGWTPGVTNMLARKATALFDEVETIAVAWGCHASDTVGKAVTLHTFHIFAGVVPSFQNGRTLRIPAGSGRELIRFPAPVGMVNVFHLGHPEPVTIPRHIEAQNVTLKGGLVEDYFNVLGKVLSFLRIINTRSGKDFLGAIVNPLLPVFEKIDKPPETASACRVDTTGKKDGKRVHLAYGAVAHMDVLTGIPASIAVQMLLEGTITATGVLPPEACLDSGDFLKRARENGIRLFQGDEMTEALEL
ncbi:MAG: saccharopine dehydrogenase NADP-binding domain-containing protein [Deltaproteobacteria bacterium]|nr:saccharopine dehydrogenase NADP-binding domain-containing protein [Deltaproteobacteria bacterium]